MRCLARSCKLHSEGDIQLRLRPVSVCFAIFNAFNGFIRNTRVVFEYESAVNSRQYDAFSARKPIGFLLVFSRIRPLSWVSPPGRPLAPRTPPNQLLRAARSSLSSRARRLARRLPLARSPPIVRARIPIQGRQEGSVSQSWLEIPPKIQYQELPGKIVGLKPSYRRPAR